LRSFLSPLPEEIEIIGVPDPSLLRGSTMLRHPTGESESRRGDEESGLGVLPVARACGSSNTPDSGWASAMRQARL